MGHKYVIELKILAIISMTNLNDLQTHIILFSIHISVLKEQSMFLLPSNIGRICFDLDHLATMVWLAWQSRLFDLPNVGDDGDPGQVNTLVVLVVRERHLVRDREQANAARKREHIGLRLLYGQSTLRWSRPIISVARWSRYKPFIVIFFTQTSPPSIL
jgi:hypothetical protein